MSEQMILDIPSEDDGYIEVFKDLATIVTIPLWGIVDNFMDGVVTISIGKTDIKIPSSYQILQTEGGEVDFIDASNLLDVPLFTCDGRLAINEIEDYKVTVDDTEHDWVVRSIDKKHYFILDRGIVVNPYRSNVRGNKNFEVEL